MMLVETLLFFVTLICMLVLLTNINLLCIYKTIYKLICKIALLVKQIQLFE